ncbi:MAG: recombinase family protein [bacterium]
MNVRNLLCILLGCSALPVFQSCAAARSPETPVLTAESGISRDSGVVADILTIDFSTSQGYKEDSLIGQPEGASAAWRNGNPATLPDAYVVNEALFLNSDANGGKSRHHGRWILFPIPPQTSGSVSISWDWRYVGPETRGLDCGFAVADSTNFAIDGDPAANWNELGPSVHMTPSGPTIEACSGDGTGGRTYVALSEVRYTDGDRIAMRLNIDIDSQRYGLFAAKEHQPEILLAKNCGFRRAMQQGLDTIALWENGMLAGSGIFIDNIAVSTIPASPSKSVRCAIYTRESDPGGPDDQFIPVAIQKAAAKWIIARHKEEGWQAVDKTYTDECVEDISQRPGLQELLKDVKQGEIDCILLHGLDSLSRSLSNFVWIMDIFETYNVRLLCVKGDFDAKSPQFQYTLGILRSFARYEREQKTEEPTPNMTTGGGWQMNDAILGYEFNNPPEHFKINSQAMTVNSREAGLVRSIFKRFLKLKSAEAVAESLNKDKSLTKIWLTPEGLETGGDPFDPHQVKAILRNPTYLGKGSYNTEAIIDRTIYDQAGDILNQD